MKVLIVGAGLAGYCTAHHLLETGAEILIIDNGKNVSSAVAAGIINPVVFRRTTLSWRVTELIAYGYPFYQKLEELTGQHFFRKVPIRRLFSHEQERETWLKKQDQENFSSYLKPLSKEDLEFDLPQNTFGTGIVLNSASVNAKIFLEANKQFFISKGYYKNEQFDHEKLDPEAGSYNNETFDHVIFCEGKDALYNPWFSNLPLSQTKGEILDVKLPLPASESLNRKCFLMPQEDGTFKTGSTYVWDTDDNTPTEEGKKQILKNLASITEETAEVIRHEAGVRPTVSDRRPLLGRHPEFPKLVILNGLGTKGYMIAPLISRELVEHLVNNTELHPETAISRFRNA